MGDMENVFSFDFEKVFKKKSWTMYKSAQLS